jgi:fibronectin type 3 domain-containing protein
MRPTHRSATTQLFTLLLTGVLVAGLSLTSAGCDGGGSNGNGGPDQQDTTPPSAPSNLAADASDAFVSLSWTAVDDAAAYNVYRATSSTDGVSGSALETGLSRASYADETAENGTTYYYRVTAVDTAGNESDGSGEVQSTPFATPGGLTGQSGDAQIELSWSAAAGAATYNVYRSTTSTGGAEGDPLATDVSQASYTDTAAENGTKYYYRVTAVNPEDEESDASGEVAKTPFSDPSRP